MTKTSDNYEHFIQKVIESLVVGVTVHHHRVYIGRVSNRKIKMDVSFNYTVAEGADVLFLLECKCYNHKVPVDEVEDFTRKSTILVPTKELW